MSFISSTALGRRLSYEFLWLATAGRSTAINVGFSPVDAEVSKNPKFERDPHQIQLYAELCRFAGFAGRDWLDLRVLEAGCGTGQGMSYIQQTFMPRTLVGLDYSKAAVLRAQARGLDAIRGSVDDLPFGDASFDCVLCIDSLGSFPAAAFLEEATRVLRPGGSLLIADYRRGTEQNTASHLTALVDGTALRLAQFENATAGVLRALDEDDARKAALIAWLPRLVRNALAETLSLKDSIRYRSWKSGAMTYYLAKLERTAQPAPGI